MRVAVHVTHESARKIGGIGAVLSGLCNSQAYKEFYEQTVLYGPLFGSPRDVFSDIGRSGELLFSSQENYDAANYREKLDDIVKKYRIDIVYAKRKLFSDFDLGTYCVVDVINVGITTMDNQQVEKFKYKLWEKFGIKSQLYENDWDYQQYVRIAVPYLEILEKLYGSDAQYHHFAHEYMGVPSALSVLLAGKKDKTAFVAHEVAPARSLVENLPGHDISFYNIVRKARSHKSFEQAFGSQEHNSRSELIKRAVNFDHVFVVGGHVKDEYLFLVPDAPADKIIVVPNGVSTHTADFEQKQRSRKRIQKYAETLFNFTPDVILTHVSRLVPSKGIWRDIALLWFLDEICVARNLKGIYILLSTLITTGRSQAEVFKMESEYGWPVLHKEGWPDLIGAENDIYTYLQIFNAKSKAIKGVFLNQFGFERSRCGNRVPEDAQFTDLRTASDAEIGLSIYEPFGIAQIETIPFGGVSILSSSCGAAQFLEEKFRDAPIKPYYVLDYVAAGRKMSYSSLQSLTLDQRTALESEVHSEHAPHIFDLLALTPEMRQQYLLGAQELASRISWESSAQTYISCLNPST